MKKHGPWTIKKSNIKYEDAWVNLSLDEVIKPDGEEGKHVLIKIVPGVSVLPIDEKGYVYLIDEFHYALGRKEMQTASGAINENESPQIAAERELSEELGIEAKEWINLGVLNPFTAIVNSPAYLFLVKDLNLKESHTEGTEEIKLKKVKLEEAVKMVMESKITHGPSAVLILKANEYFK